MFTQVCLEDISSDGWVGGRFFYSRCLEYRRGQWPSYERQGKGKSEREGRRQGMERGLEAEAGKSQSEREEQKQRRKRRAKEGQGKGGILKAR